MLYPERRLIELLYIVGSSPPPAHILAGNSFGMKVPPPEYSGIPISAVQPDPELVEGKPHLCTIVCVVHLAQGLK